MILVDANSIAHQAKHSLGNLSFAEKQTGVVFGFLQQILTLARTMESNEFVFVWDSRKSLRMEIFPDYKKARRREKTDEEKELDDLAYKQFLEIREDLIPSLGFSNNFMIDGFEGDDVIASIVHDNPGEQFAIISTDEDLYQLLSDNVYMYSTRKKKSYTHLNLWKDFRITPKEWADVKAIGGCSSDGVPGVPGVGEITACKYLTRKLNLNSKVYRAIRENKKLIDFNKRLVRLPFENTPIVRLEPFNKLDFFMFKTICGQYGFRSFLEKDRLAQWKEFVFKENNDGQ